MKIVHVITRLLKAGSEENTIYSAIHQANEGHDVWIIHGNEFNPSWHQQLSPQMTLIEVSEMVHPVSPAKDWAAILQLRALYREIQPDVIHTHQSKAGILGRAAAIGAAIPAVVHTVHIAPFLNVSPASKAIYTCAEAASALVTDLIINVSKGMRDACLAHGVGTKKKNVVIYSGMPLERFQLAAPPEDWRKRIGGWATEARPRLILMLAAFEPRKRQDEFLVALAPRLRADRNLGLIFAGTGERIEMVRERAAALGVQDQVRFMGHDPEPETLIALADVCVLTSEREGLPRVVVQYLACGKPVVLTDLPGIDELISTGHNGLIVQADDVAGAAEAAADLLGDTAKLALLSEGARATDVSHWEQRRMGEEIVKAYESVLIRKAAAKSGYASSSAR